MLHITNGDGAARRIEETGLGGHVLPWRDVLHEGPVPAGISSRELSLVRARFIMDRGWGEFSAVLREFEERDSLLAGASAHDEVVLWFEHDLYDQLQLIQVLSEILWTPGSFTLSLICIDDFPGVQSFSGLGQLAPAQMLTLWPAREPATEKLIETAREAWTAVRSPDPTTLLDFLNGEHHELPFLNAAIKRLLEEYPSPAHGLGRTDLQILQALALNRSIPADIFGVVQGCEAAPFLGDSTCWSHLAALASGRIPLVASISNITGPPAFGEDHSAFLAAEFALTVVGRDVFAGKSDAIALNEIDRWIGGGHLHGFGPVWRWDGSALTLG